MALIPHCKTRLCMSKTSLFSVKITAITWIRIYHGFFLSSLFKNKVTWLLMILCSVCLFVLFLQATLRRLQYTFNWVWGWHYPSWHWSRVLGPVWTHCHLTLHAQIHTCTHFFQHAYLCTLGANWTTQRKPTQTEDEHANFIHVGPRHVRTLS